MVSEKYLYQICQRLIVPNVQNIIFLGKSILVFGDLYQLPQVNVMSVYASSADSGEPTNYIVDKL